MPPVLKDVLQTISVMETKKQRDAAKALASQLTDEAQIAMAEQAWEARMDELRNPKHAEARAEI